MSKPRLIKNKKDLPSEFSLSKYTVLEKSNLEDWLSQIEARVLVSSIIHSPLSDTDDPYWRNYSHPDKTAMALLKDPINAAYRRTTKVEGSYININDITIDKKLSYRLPLPDYLHPYLSEFNDFWKGRSKETALIDKPYWEVELENGLLPDSIDITVNLNATDEMLLEEFQSWLSTIRKEIGVETSRKKIGEKKNNKEIKSWCHNRILPYMDLTNWAKANNCKITDSLMGDVLFPNRYCDRTGMIRKTVGPLAKKVCSHSFARALRTQLVNEKAAEKKPFFMPGIIVLIPLPE